MLLYPLSGHTATSIELEWRPNTEPDLLSYMVYMRTEGEQYHFDKPLWEGTQNSCAVDIPDETQLYYFVVRAVSSTGTISPNSDEVCYGCIPCPDDPNKNYSGACGCGIPDKDIDADGIWDCFDTDDDSDGIDDTIEDTSPNQGDANRDGIQDCIQKNVGSFSVDEDASYIVIETPEGTHLNGFERMVMAASEDPPAGIEFPFGQFRFNIGSISLYDTVKVTITLPESESPYSYYAYGATFETQNYHWYEFLFDGETGVEIDENIMTLYFSDGLRGDNILEIDNRVEAFGGPVFKLPEEPEEPEEPSTELNPDIPTTPETDIGCFLNFLLR